MTDLLTLRRDGWLNYLPNDDGEGSVATRLRISVGKALITRNISKRAGGESEAVNVSLLPLAEFLTKAWWPLLYEPLRPSFTRAFQVRHRLDTGMRGYSFPAIALCSGGEKSIVADWASIGNPHSPISFLTPAPVEPIQLDRQQTEFALMDLVESVLERLDGANLRRQLLREAWSRIEGSMAEPDELGYCITAGRLGLDPYDPDAPDLAHLAKGLPDELFGDLSDAVELNELGTAVGWLREVEPRLARFPEVQLSSFGAPVEDDLDHPAWTPGEASAIALRVNSGLRNEPPRKAVEELLGAAAFPGGEVAAVGPNALTAVIRRLENSARIATVARSARQRRFRACAATYVAWTSVAGEDRASTEAITRRQQASRAFAAEMLAPKDALLDRAPRHGFDSDDLEDIASDFVCPYPTVMWQAHRAGIALRGVELPFVDRMRII
jgi:hypothetical protein